MTEQPNEWFSPWIVLPEFGPSHAHPNVLPSTQMRGRFRGCLIGGAIGDALGRPVETWPADAVRRRYPDGVRDFEPWSGWNGGPMGTFTDDTQLTIVVAEHLLEDWHWRPSDLAHRIVDWGPTGRGVGRATRQALQNYSLGIDPAGVPSAGNGAAMRAAPYGLAFAGRAPQQVKRAIDGSMLTHDDRTAASAAITQAAAVNLSLASDPDTLDPVAFLEKLVALFRDFELPELPLRSGRGSRSLPQVLEEVADFLDKPARTTFDHFYNGAFVLETMPCVLWCFLANRDDPERALVAAASGGRDSDTIAAMVGNLSGALHGVDAFPERWVGENLEDFDRLLQLADGLYELRWPGPLQVGDPKWQGGWLSVVQRPEPAAELASSGGELGWTTLLFGSARDPELPEGTPVAFWVDGDDGHSGLYATGVVEGGTSWTAVPDRDTPVRMGAARFTQFFDHLVVGPAELRAAGLDGLPGEPTCGQLRRLSDEQWILLTQLLEQRGTGRHGS